MSKGTASATRSRTPGRIVVCAVGALAFGLALAVAACGNGSSSADGDGGADACAPIFCPLKLVWSLADCRCIDPNPPVDASNSTCVLGGGTCAESAAENQTCPEGSYEAALPNLTCPKNRGGLYQSCCVARDGNGQLPPATHGACACGDVLLCPAGSRCLPGVDSVECYEGDAGGDVLVPCTPP